MYQMQATNFNQCSSYVRGHFFAYFVSHLLTCLLTLTFAYKYATMLILGGTDLGN